MLWLRVLIRAILAPFRLWWASLALGAPTAGLFLLLTLRLGGRPPADPAFWAVTFALVLLWLFALVTLGIAWHRLLLSTRSLSVLTALRGQPRWRYLALSLLSLAIGIAFVIAIQQVISLPRVAPAMVRWTGLWVMGSGLPDQRFAAYLFVTQAWKPVVIGVSFTLFGMGLPGMAIGQRLPYARVLGFAFRHAHHVALAWTATAFLGFGLEHAIDEVMKLSLPARLFYESSLGLWAGLLFFTLALLWAVGLVTEFYRSLRDSLPAETETPQV